MSLKKSIKIKENIVKKRKSPTFSPITVKMQKTMSTQTPKDAHTWLPTEKYDISDETLHENGIECEKHDYYPEPREIGEHTTYRCRICGAESGCP